MRAARAFLLPVLMSAASAAELEPATLKAWENYQRAADEKAKTRAQHENRFLMVDDFPEVGARLRRREIWVSAVGRNGSESVPSGLIHHCVGAAFIPKVSLERVLSTVRSYGQYSEFYRPVVIESRCISTDSALDRFSMLWFRKAFFTAVTLEAEYESHYAQVGERRWMSASYGTRIQEIADYGNPKERRFAPGEGSGFIWRLTAFGRYEERGGGVLVEVEAIALSREIPASIHWLVAPIVARASKDALTRSLEQTRDAVTASIINETKRIAQKSCRFEGVRSTHDHS